MTKMFHMEHFVQGGCTLHVERFSLKVRPQSVVQRELFRSNVGAGMQYRNQTPNT